MTIYADRIASAVEDLLEGTLGTTRTVGTTVFGFGTFEGLAMSAQQARTIQTATRRHRFDVRVLDIVPHKSTPISIKSSHRNVRVSIWIDIATTLKSVAQESDRKSQRAAIANDADTALQALTYPGNLTLDGSGNATNIISGMLMGPDGAGLPTWSVISEDWKTHMLKSSIKASAVVVVTQATS